MTLVLQVMGDIPGVPGLFVAGVFSGALSTVSSGLNSLAAVCLKDFIASGCNINLSDEKQTIITKVLAVVFGVIGYGMVFMVKYLPGVLEAALGIFGIVGGPVLGAFTLGMFFPFATSVVSLYSNVFTKKMIFPHPGSLYRLLLFTDFYHVDGIRTDSGQQGWNH